MKHWNAECRTRSADWRTPNAFRLAGLFGLTLLLSLAGAARFQGEDASTGSVTSPHGKISWRGLRGTVNLREGTIVLTGSSPKGVFIEDTGSGMTLIARSMSCTLVRSGNTYSMQQATLAEAAQALLDNSKAQGRKPGDPIVRSQIESDQLIYTAAGEEGTLTMPKPVQMTTTVDGKGVEKQNGQKVPYTFQQLAKSNGRSGRVVAFIPAKSTQEPALRTAHFDGPVRFSSVRTATYTNTPTPRVTTLNGVGDVLDADFLGENVGTVTLSGSIKIDVEDQGAKLSQTGEKAVVTLDKTTQEVTGFDMSGTPATLTVPKQNIPSAPRKNGGKTK